MSILPIILSGETLGHRHKNLNALVDRAYNSNVNFQELQSIPDNNSPVDRMFKIDLASKLRNIDYIIENLKQDDILFVSKALKCKWLLKNEYKHIIEPDYLEQELYPFMITTAVNKMKCWISVNLKEPERCQIFYHYYFEKTFHLAIRFLTHCHVSYILNEIPKILHRLDPFYLKVFCERSPEVAKIFFDSLSTNEKVLKSYLKEEDKYYDALNVILKTDACIYLDIIEKYFNKNRFRKLSAAATKYVVKFCKERLIKKVELYAAWLLDMKMLAKCLNIEECKDVVLKLARAEYLSNWFTYKNVEPLIKRLPDEERSAFKKMVFVAKDIGTKIDEWQYETPAPPITKDECYLFEDTEHSPREYDDSMDFRKMLKKRKCGFLYDCARMETECKVRTMLDQLFNEFRFMSFEKTLYELRKRILVESLPLNRQYMLLVLVSKTGGRTESLSSLLTLLARHLNEPPHLRATVVRSLIKRACVWRLPQEQWECLMTFATGLGLDGKNPEAVCREGLHAVVLRSLLRSGCVDSNIFSAFIDEFSTLKEYKLTINEQRAVTERLPALLLASIVAENDTEKQANLFTLLFQTLDDYKLPIDACPVVPALAALASKDHNVAKSLLMQLFDVKKARRELFEQNFACVSTAASYVNALRHDPEILKKDTYVKRALDGKSKREQFFRKLALYFNEVNGLADLYLSAIKEKITTERDVKLARPLAILLASNLENYIKELDREEEKAAKRFANAMKANVHLARPKLDIENTGYRVLGPKAVSNMFINCPDVYIERHLEIILKWPRTLRLALELSKRLNKDVQVFEIISVRRPKVALKCAMRYFSHNSVNSEAIWEIIKPIVKKYDLDSNKPDRLSKRIWKVGNVPEKIRADYCTVLYEAIKMKSNKKANKMLCHIENMLPKVSEEFIEELLSQVLESKFSLGQDDLDKDFKMKAKHLYLRILIKFVLLSKLEATQTKRYEKFVEPCLKFLSTLEKDFMEFFTEMINALRYNTVFFNEEYVTCLPVFERIVAWMHTICPMDTCFKYYGEIHLTMLFYKSVRQCLKHRPNLFKDKNKSKELVDTIGRTFGTYIAKEVDDLKSAYFDSMIELYKIVLVKYLNDYFDYDPLKDSFIMNIIRGVVEHGKDRIPLLGLYLFDEISYLSETDTAKEIMEILYKINNEELQFILETKKFA